MNEFIVGLLSTLVANSMAATLIRHGQARSAPEV